MSNAAPSAPGPGALLFDLHRNSTHDGPGMRSTVFFKGCPLGCRWCHNPESQRVQPEVWWRGDRCRACGACVAACASAALRATPAGIAIARSQCTGCHACVDACASAALEPLGRWWTLEALLAEVERDRPWYASSGGGVTLSGGEPLSQPEAALAFLSACRARGLHTALDTCGQGETGHFTALLQQADLLLFDLKHDQEEAHRDGTGVGLERIHAHLRLAMARARSRRLELWIRTPLIPGSTADPGVIAAIGRRLRSWGGGEVSRWELCAFNPSCRGKYARLDRTWAYGDQGLMGERETAVLMAAARDAFGDAGRVQLRGLRRR